MAVGATQDAELTAVYLELVLFCGSSIVIVTHYLPLPFSVDNTRYSSAMI